MKVLILGASLVVIFSAASAVGQESTFTPTAPETDWTKVDRGALGARLDKIRNDIAAKKKLAAQQAASAKALRKKHNDEVPAPYDPSREGYEPAPSLDPMTVVIRQRELAQLRTQASELEASTRAIEAEITDLGWEEVKLSRDMRRATNEAVQAMVRREQAAEDAAKEAERVRKINERAQAARDKQFQEAIETMAVTQSFIGLQSMVNDTNRTLDELERKYDQALLGAYMKDKMTTLLGSKAFCSATANCDPGLKEKKPFAAEMNEVFPWSDPKLNRTTPRSSGTKR